MIESTWTLEGASRPITLKTGGVAEEADASLLIECGGSTLLATLVVGPSEGRVLDFVPLTVEYRERASAIGEFPGGMRRREGRPEAVEF